MTKIIRVRYEKGVLKPLDNVEFREGEELLVKVVEELGGGEGFSASTVRCWAPHLRRSSTGSCLRRRSSNALPGH